MAVYFVTGKLGSGKSLIAIKRIQEYHLAGRPVATNMDVFLEHMLPKENKEARHIRLPDKPTSDDLMSLGHSYEGDYDEEKNGLVVLDELGSWLNSRSWNDKARVGFIEWAIHARKFGWDVIFLVQHLEMVDAQIRNSMCEYLVSCRRMDRVKIPGTDIKMPRVHIGTVYYGATENDKMVVETWRYRGNNLFASYDTRQVFSILYNVGVHSVLPPAYYIEQDEKETTEKKGIKKMKTMITLSAVGLVIAGIAYGGVNAYDKMTSGTVVASTEPEQQIAAAVAPEPFFDIMAGERDTPEPQTSFLFGMTYAGYIRVENEGVMIVFTDAMGDTDVFLHKDEFEAMGVEIVAYDNRSLVIDDHGDVRIYRVR